MVAGLGGVQGIGPDWLRGAVEATEAATFADLSSVRAERLGEGLGMLTELHRLHLGYAPGRPAGPATLVAKLPSPVPEVLQMARDWELYRREVLFYRDIAPRVGLRVPKPYVAQFDPDTHDFALVLEDVAPAIGGDQVVGLPLEHARLALDALADLHARWWDHPELKPLESAIQPFGEGPWVGSGARLAAAWPQFRPFLVERATPILVQVAERLPAAIEPLMIDMAAAPRTLCHGDFRADNLMFALGDQGPVLVTLDWQVSLQARGVLDVSQLLSISVTSELRRAHEASLLNAYFDRLVAAGVQNYDYEAFFQDYRRGLLIGLFYVILSGGANDLTQPRAAALFDSAVRRLDAVVQDHALEEFVA